jgi:hypothetical protein
MGALQRMAFVSECDPLRVINHEADSRYGAFAASRDLLYPSVMPGWKCS